MPCPNPNQTQPNLTLIQSVYKIETFQKSLPVRFILPFKLVSNNKGKNNNINQILSTVSQMIQIVEISTVLKHFGQSQQQKETWKN